MNTIAGTARMVQQTKINIIATAEELYNTAGIKALSMNNLAATMRMSKKTIYRCFVSKSDLIASIATKRIEQTKCALEEKKISAKNSLQETFTAWHLLDEFIVSLNMVNLQQLPKYFDQAIKQVNEFKQDFLYRHFKSNIERGITEELYRANLRPEIISRHMIDILFMPRNPLIFDRFHVPGVEIDNQLLTFHLYGLATVKGAGLIRKYKNESLAHFSKFESAAHN